MGIEIEAKFRLPDVDKLRERLSAAGARRRAAVLEHNTYFDTPENALRDSDRGLRIRAIETSGAEAPALLTYKGPRRPGELKIRQEEEVTVSSVADAEALLAGLGYRPTMAFQKRRESFELEAAKVELDELPELGFFLEIEAGDERTVNQVRSKLGLAEEPTVTSTYLALVAEHLAARAGGSRTELTF